MATSQTVPTVKYVVISGEDKYKKEQMIAWLKRRGMLDSTSETFIRRGKR
jgi:hypothetical protein